MEGGCLTPYTVKIRRLFCQILFKKQKYGTGVRFLPFFLRSQAFHSVFIMRE
jgi:hypothetical protein